MRFLLFAGLFCFSALLAAGAVRLSEPVESTEDYEIFGAPMGDKSPGMSLKEAIAREESLDGMTVRITTRVAKVCQKKGCFFIATEGSAWARVTFANYEFFVPTDSAGSEVTLEGTFSRRELTAEEAGHYADDLGEPAPAGPVPRFEYSIVATSVMLKT